MCFVDQKDESFYTVSWACNIDGTTFVVAGGINGIIRVIDASNEKIHKVFIASVHSNYVDCNEWLGNLSCQRQLQSVDNEIVLWEPKMKEQSPGESVGKWVFCREYVDILQKYPVPECDIWFIKFSCDFHYSAAAVVISMSTVKSFLFYRTV
ncbi:hypothetical protein GH714_008301 [Hevea brasiliensis]|uniref:Anaphase-promoting complex subunit 4 WD40 domain-containing protein n=1 Tax=Hevea brasiliensis TaxID=3981 RepID=A0A6A6KAG0_HEVBR|nr:hypothetical protein GH714_008301 [Hevea brasiliensis]